MKAELLDEVIKQSGMTVTEFCNKTGIAHSTFYRKRAGEVPFNTHEVRMICVTLKLKDAKQIKNIFLD